MKNGTIINCLVTNNIVGNDNSNVTMYNSIVNNPGSNIGLVNCVIRSYPAYASELMIRNSIFINTNTTSYYTDELKFSASTTIQNSVVTGYTNYSSYFFAKSPLVENTQVVTLSSIFDTYTNYSSLVTSDNFKLTETAQEKYLGDDGTQVGIYGGSYPYSLTPTYPRITKFNVDSRANNGKLGVEIEVTEASK